jgi:hypothetical protein
MIFNHLNINIKKEICNDFEFIYIENNDFWQKPVITEKQIFDNFFIEKNIPYNYIAFPWASYIDNEWTKKYNDLDEIINNEELIKNMIDVNKNYFTVVQHISFNKYIELFKKFNIKIIFTSHVYNNYTEIEKEHNIIIVPISLFPIMNNNYESLIEYYNKKYLLSFVGQTNHEIMISDIRTKICDLFNEKPNCLIKSNSEWFFQKNVYETKDNLIYKDFKYEDFNYKEILRNSKFSLCPSGTGPNTIRIWESLSFGAIPVLLSDDLKLPVLIDVNYDEFIIFWKESNIDMLYDYLINISDDTINSMSNKCIEIYNKYFSPEKMNNVIKFVIVTVLSIQLASISVGFVGLFYRDLRYVHSSQNKPTGWT